MISRNTVATARLLAAATFSAAVAAVAAADSSSTVDIIVYSNTQCPCSAQFVSDTKQFLLDDASFKGMLTFRQRFAGDPANVNKCIHGPEECVGDTHFLCAQNASKAGIFGDYVEDPRWLDFQFYAYGTCTACAAIMGPQCPCDQYTTFPLYAKNNQASPLLLSASSSP